jgi:hypothetical protein
MMGANAILRAALLVSAALGLSLSVAVVTPAQDVGADVGGAGIFRAKNPETKKKGPGTTSTKPDLRERLRPVSPSAWKTCWTKVIKRVMRATLPARKTPTTKC